MTLQWHNLSAMQNAAAEPSPDLFDSAAWAAVIACLGARCWLGIDRNENRRIILFVWQKGPVRVGYLGFPVSPAWLLTDSIWQSRGSMPLPERIDLLRVNFSTLDTSVVAGPPGLSLPESAIPDLSAWPLRNQRKIRKDLALGVRHGVKLCNATPDDATTIFSIYEQTVSRHRGRLRYNLDYFKALTLMSAGCEDVQVRLARDQQKAIGFCVTVKQADRGYYLHAGVAEGCRHLGAADLLADDAIRWAISRSCRSFSMMASPQDQPGLHKFKQKWSEEDGQWTTIHMPHGVLGRLTELVLSLGN